MTHARDMLREMERVHRPEELEMLLTQSYEHGLLGPSA